MASAIFFVRETDFGNFLSSKIYGSWTVTVQSFWRNSFTTYLIKVFDSKEMGFIYEVKIFKINYDKFELVNKIKLN